MRFLRRLFDRSRRDQRAAAARYMEAIGHDLPLEERARTLRGLAVGRADRCVLCGARLVREPDGSIAGWVITRGLNGVDEHEHETS